MIVQNSYCSRVSSNVAEYWPLLLPSLFILVSFFNTNEGSAYELHAEEMGRKKFGRRVVSPFSLLPLRLLLCRGGLQVSHDRMQTILKR